MSALPDEDRARGNVYALLGNLLAGPPDAGMLHMLRGISPEADDDSLLAAAWQMLAVAASRTDHESLREEYDALFIGVGRGELVPYGSWYLTGFLMEQPLAQLRGDLRELGIERQAGVHEPEDHAAALCDTMALLITADEPAPLDQQHGFFARHLEPWMPRFFRDLQQAESARFYRAVGQLGELFIGVEAQAFRVSVPAAGAAKPS
ncbi:MAG: molecular chaperone TorD family protein [Steroidobacteraceae bacterium]|nr:molecular chaperone TorD family protein [Steroidobacteraceae bacterium]